MHEVVTINREVDAIEIPSGKQIKLFEGTEVTITQALGGTFTVVTHQGAMSSISGKNADALGKKVEKISTITKDGKPKDAEEMVWDQLKTCYDPEIPHNIVDLGLIYKCEITDLENEQKKVYVRMTLTAPGCGMGDYIKEDVRSKVAAIPNVTDVEVEVVFDPPWDRSRMSPALRREYM